MIPVRPSNNVVALRVIGAAVFGIAATGSCGLALNNYVMNLNNEYERALAVKVGWNLQEAKLYAFDESHPNNRSTSALADIAKQKKSQVVRRCLNRDFTCLAKTKITRI